MIYVNQIKQNVLSNIQICRFTMATDLLLAQDGIAEGDAIIIDMTGSTLSHLTRVNLMALKKFMFYIQVGFGLLYLQFISVIFANFP